MVILRNSPVPFLKLDHDIIGLDEMYIVYNAEDPN